MNKTNSFTKIIIILFVIIFIAVSLYALFNRNMDDGNNGIINNTLNNNSSINNTIKNNNDNYGYVIINDYCFIVNKNKNKYNECSLSRVDSQKFIVYSNDNYLGKLYLKRGVVWNLFDDNHEYVKYNGFLMACSDNIVIHPINISILNFNLDNINVSSKYKNLYVNNGDFEHYYYINGYGNLTIMYYKENGMTYKTALYSNNNELFEVFKINVEEDKNKTSYSLYNAYIYDNQLYLSFYNYSELNDKNNLTIYKFDGNKFTKVI